MSCEPSKYRRYSWCPEDDQGREHLALSRWLEETLGEKCGLVLSLWGGVTAEELFSIPPGTLPALMPTPDTLEELAGWDWEARSAPPDGGE